MESKKENLWENVWTIPNILSFIRLLLVPVEVYLFYTDQLMAAMVVFVVATCTDAVDGYIARHYNQTSPLGKWLDPIADKLMLWAVLYCLGRIGAAPMWIFIFMLAKDAAILLGGLFLYKKKDTLVYANMPGKVATVAFAVAIVMAFFYDQIAPWHTYMLYLATVLAGIALLYYAYHNVVKPFILKK